MEFVNNKKDIKRNMATLLDGIQQREADEIDLIRRGRNIVIGVVNECLVLMPSRFGGLKNNSMETHNQKKIDEAVDGRETTPEITRALGFEDEENPLGLHAYLRFFAALGLKPYKYKKTFWILPGAEAMLSEFGTKDNSTKPDEGLLKLKRIFGIND